MPITQRCYPLVKSERLTDDIYSFWIDCPDIAAQAVPGCFLHVLAPGFLLRRPISVSEIHDNRLRLVFGVRGAGTERLSKLQPGDLVDLLGPLGNGFALKGRHAKAVLVGGGIGVPPLLELARRFERPDVFLGFRDIENAILCEDFRAAGAKVTLATEDGSAGHHGYITLPLESYLKTCAPDVIYACGPTALLKAVRDLAIKHDIPAQLSLEERMACGVGACLGCAVPILTPDGDTVYRRVCKDGPVFSAKEVVL